MAWHIKYSVSPMQSCLFILLNGKCGIYKRIFRLFSYSEGQKSLISDVSSQKLSISDYHFLSLTAVPYEFQPYRKLFVSPYFKVEAKKVLLLVAILFFYSSGVLEMPDISASDFQTLTLLFFCLYLFWGHNQTAKKNLHYLPYSSKNFTFSWTWILQC